MLDRSTFPEKGLQLGHVDTATYTEGVVVVAASHNPHLFSLASTSTVQPFCHLYRYELVFITTYKQNWTGDCLNLLKIVPPVFDHNAS